MSDIEFPGAVIVAAPFQRLALDLAAGLSMLVTVVVMLRLALTH